MNSTQGPPALTSHQSFQSHYSAFSHHSSARDTQSTLAPSLFSSSTPTLVNGGPVEAADNVLNKRADKDTSLFQRCLILQMRLCLIPGFEGWQQLVIREEKEAAAQRGEAYDELDIVSLLWRTFQKGYPLMDIYNTLGPKVPLAVDEHKVTEKNRGKTAAYQFMKACLEELKFSSEDCFVLRDLYGNDTTGFVKVTNVVNRVLDILVQMGIISADREVADADAASVNSTHKRTQREHIIDELVRTERTYVQHLELLQDFKKLVEEKGVVTGDSVHDIFHNLNSLLDTQRRFLIRVEQTNYLPPEDQNWGQLFVVYKTGFEVYEPFIANQKRSEEVVMREFDKLKETGGPQQMQQMVESPTHLTSFLMKPFQRLTRYMLLLKELRDKGDLDQKRREDLSRGMDAVNSILEKTNAAVDRELRVEAVEELKTLVEDWKGHRIEAFGELLLYGQFTVLKGDSINAKNEEREYKIYLFEMILLCCKEINPNKQKNRMKPLGRNGKPKLQLKGRIFMQNVTETVSLSKPGSYTCQIYWKGDPGIENFVIKFSSEETMKKWATQVDMQRRVWKDHARSSSSTNQSQSRPSDVQFQFLRDTTLENPYQEDDDDEDDEDVDTVIPGYPVPHDMYAPHNMQPVPSRSRSTTGDSGPPLNGLPSNGPPGIDLDNRMLPPGLRAGYPQSAPLTLRTQQLAASGNMQDSYFSPTGESPTSALSNARTSSSSAGTFPFPRQAVPPQGWQDEKNRHTAPPPGRGHISRDGSLGPNRGMQRPSLPANAGSGMMSQGRLRAASSPDIHNAAGSRRVPQGQAPPVPDLPPFPTHFAYNAAIVNRSQSNSPNSLPPRQGTNSPAVQRDRLVQQRTAAELANPDYLGGSARRDRDPGHTPLSRTMTPHSSFERTLTPLSMESRTMSPALSADTNVLPTQLKVKVHCPSAGSTMTLVVSTTISFQSLKDRIDAKLQRSTSVSLSAGQVKLKYLDEDDYVNIQSDEDVQTAFETWKEQQRDLNPGGLGEIELFCQ
ncbi:hypothetical protein M011DRAFT_456744 [Sporormia fimetaria CBS 119925]|uniref:DH domain-containing protein n=1 Tax=Sporormia fimetaria CBS 119925 TaxID=1340428 RepID=A0A6A6VJP7_9PLEO|nr:hypothetical protein M011DRAFT_456744 [Sporormia fimetaria CBS 119925]